jgi:two-component system response regulator YesN
MYTLLIADDEKTERDLVRFLLTQKYDGIFSLVEAENGKQALDIINSKHIDILISDIQMPIMSGIDLAKAVRSSYPDIEILFFSGYDDFEFVQDALILHAVNYILKPIDPDKFAASIKDILSKLGSSKLQFTNSYSFIEQNFYEGTINTDAEEIPNHIDDSRFYELENAIRFKQKDNIKAIVEELLNGMYESKSHSHIYIRYMATSIMRIIMSAIDDISASDFDDVTKEIFTLKHYSDIHALVLNYCDILINKINKDSSGSHYAVNLVQQYINEHYAEDLSLNSLSDMVFLNPNYLSNIFAKETSYTLNKYIKKVRMEKAGELLLNTNKKIATIAKETGYTSTSYFIKAFQSIYGTTPEKFRTGI